MNHRLVTPLIVLVSFAATFGFMSWRAGLWHVASPDKLTSRGGVLRVDLSIRSYPTAIRRPQSSISLKASRYANDTAIFITFDEGGGYYDSGYVQPVDYFGDGTRIPLLVVSKYVNPGHISHRYADHVSILKFIERNWGLRPVSNRSRDNFPNPVAAVQPVRSVEYAGTG